MLKEYLYSKLEGTKIVKEKIVLFSILEKETVFEGKVETHKLSHKHITAHFYLKHLVDFWLFGINHLSEITFATPDTPILTILASLLMSDMIMVKSYPSLI